MKEVRLLDEDAVDKSYAAMVETLARLEVSTWGRMILVAAKDMSNTDVERSVLEDEN